MYWRDMNVHQCWQSKEVLLCAQMKTLALQYSVCLISTASTMHYCRSAAVSCTEMNVTASWCFPLVWFCLVLPFCIGQSNEGGTQGFRSTQHCNAFHFNPKHFPLGPGMGDLVKLRIWEQQARATPTLPTPSHEPARLTPI